MIEFRSVHGHIEVYVDDMFLFSADTMKEAKEELNETLAEARVRAMQLPAVVSGKRWQARVNAEPTNSFFKRSGSEMKSDRVIRR